jgi:serine/threonine protein kinase
LKIVQAVARQLLEGVGILARHEIVHGDLKPENVLLVSEKSMQVKIVDFGSARLLGTNCVQYLQSRYYRAPEVVLGFEHGLEIDVWSVGCLVGELYLGLPLFCGQNEIQLLELQERLLGRFPREFVERAPRKDVFFLGSGELKSEEQVQRELGKRVCKRVQCFAQNTIEDVIMKYRKGMGGTEKERMAVSGRRTMLLDLLRRCLSYEPSERITPEEALRHPFLMADLSDSA